MKSALAWLWRSGLLLVLPGSLLEAQVTTRVSVSGGCTPGNWHSWIPQISADGRYVAFASEASNLVPNDTNSCSDIFVRDRILGTTERVSVATNGTQGNGGCGVWFGISGDGRYVAFESAAANLVPPDPNTYFDVYVRDRLAGTTTRANVGPNGEWIVSADTASISADGRFVSFYTGHPVSPTDTNGAGDVYVHDLLTGSNEIASVSTAGSLGNSGGYFGHLWGDGRWVTFASASTNLVPGDTNGLTDLFLRDRMLGTTVRANVASGGAEPNGDSDVACSLSSDGRWFVFASVASNLVPGDTNGKSDIFVRDMLNGTTVRASENAAGIEADQNSYTPRVSDDGRQVLFSSEASNLVPADSNAAFDVFAKDMQTGLVARLSVDWGGGDVLGYATWPASTPDTGVVVFQSTFGISQISAQDRGYVVPSFTSFCAGDGTGAPCPCGNSGAPGHGCENSASTGGAKLAAVGTVAPDAVVLFTTGELPSALSIFLQGDLSIPTVNFGDGLRCVGGHLKRLGVVNATSGGVIFPQCVPPTITARSAAVGDPILPGQTRYYQCYYRDPVSGFCPPASAGNSFNVSNAISIPW